MHQKPVEYRSAHSFQDSLAAITATIGKAGMTLFAEIDHAKAARESGLSMPETRVLIYGNPKVGTPVMLERSLSALDLPLRILVRELPGDNSAVAFHPMSGDFSALGIDDGVADRFDQVQEMVASAIHGLRVSVVASL